MNDNADDGSNIMFIYEWVDSVPLSRPKKNIARDFSDGVLLAEMIKNNASGLVELHNYPTSHSTNQKMQNWNTLNQKVLKKIGATLTKKEIDGVIGCQPGVIENILKKVYEKLTKYSAKKDDNNKNEDSGEEELEQEEENERDINRNVGKVSKRPMGKEIDYKGILLQKDKTILELRSTLEILEMKLYNSEDENRRLSERLESLKETLRVAGKL